MHTLGESKRKEFPRFRIKRRPLRMLAVILSLGVIVPIAVIRGLIDFCIAIVWTITKVIVRNWENEKTYR